MNAPFPLMSTPRDGIKGSRHAINPGNSQQTSL
jgi:hypothetical protein